MSRRLEDEEKEWDEEFEEEPQESEASEFWKRPQRIVVEREEGDDYE